MALLLINTNPHHALWISGNIILKHSTYQANKFKPKASLHVAIRSCADIEQLWIEFPHLSGDGFILVAVVNEVDNALNAFLDGVEAIGGQRMEHTGVDDVFYLS